MRVNRVFARSSVHRRLVIASAVAAVLVVVLAATSSAPSGAWAGGDRTPQDNWVTAWAASPVVGVSIPFNPDCPAQAGLTDQTVRNVVFLSAGGDSVRVRLTNTFGLRSMLVAHATVAV